MLMLEMMKGARVLLEVCAGMKKGEKLLIVTDTMSPEVVSRALYMAAREMDIAAHIITMPVPQTGGEPSAVVAAAMQAADVILSPTTRTLFHTKATLDACNKGARLFSLTECDEWILIRNGVEADFVAISPVVKALGKFFDEGREIHVTSPGGTDFKASIVGRGGIVNTCICHEPGMRSGFPDIEANVPSIETEGEGVIVIDASASMGIGLVDSPVKLFVEKGKVVKIEGGTSATQLRTILEDAQDPNVYAIAEIAVGLNPFSPVCGKIIYDEGRYGTGHFAVGDNTRQGGVNKAPLHLDMVYWSPTFRVDGKLIVEDGKPVTGIACKALPGSR
ncbi:MAG: aminopeptidase [Synergistaceae bacterium]|jgi:leucyl aminopeptidase (aminopeptidase T)|nr:aminopeptidase [Synergistaceae bacterium]